MLGLVVGGLILSGAARSRATPPGLAPGSTPLVAADPELYPAFAPRVPDYVVRCSGRTPVQVMVTAAPSRRPSRSMVTGLAAAHSRPRCRSPAVRRSRLP